MSQELEDIRFGLTAVLGSQREREKILRDVLARLEVDEAKTLATLPGQSPQRLVDDYDDVLRRIAELEATLASPEGVQALVGTERGQFLAKYRA